MKNSSSHASLTFSFVFGLYCHKLKTPIHEFGEAVTTSFKLSHPLTKIVCILFLVMVCYLRAQAGNGLLLFPNPVKDNRITVAHAPGIQGLYRVQIYNMLGASVLSVEKNFTLDKDETIDVSELPAGVYIFSLPIDPDKPLRSRFTKNE